jgi:polyisoprenoid-binding protein YceI
MKQGLPLLTFAAIAIPAFAAEYSLEISPENTRIVWTLRDVLHTVHGTFVFKSGRIDFDTDTGKASGEVIVDVASGNSGNEARDRRMHASVLESSKYPEAVFTPDRADGTVAVPGTSNVRLYGTLSIHGAKHQMAMDVRTTATADRMNATIGFEIPYVAWGMKDPSNFLLKVDKTVKVSIEAQGTLQKR